MSNNINISKLNKIYQKVLGRNVDESGISSYSYLFYYPNSEIIIENMLYNSSEYKQKLNYKPTIKVVNGKKFDSKPIDLSLKKVLVLSLVKDALANNSLPHIVKFIDDLKKVFKLVNFGIYTNNNIDKTSFVLQEWSLKDPGVFVVVGDDESITINHKNGCGNRIHKLASYRSLILEKSLSYFNKEDFDYIIVFDSDLYENIDIKPIIDSIKINTNWSSISANSCYTNSRFHYDALALRFPNDPIDIKSIYKNFDKFYGKDHNWIDTLYIFNDFVEVDSAFGGLTIYHANEIADVITNNTSPYSCLSLPDGTCEHIPLSLSLKNKKYINSNIKIPNKETLINIINSQPTMFIPRDAGFFSVFNFLVGAIAGGNKTYPYFNKSKFLEYRDSNQHFCYWTKNDNSWFDFFDPIKYDDNDETHKNKNFLNYNISHGDEASPEFKSPSEINKLLKNDIDSFNSWRKNINTIYNEYIKFNEKTIQSVNQIYNSMFKNNEYIIGIHYRHPSHFAESGPIFLRQYFEQIDKILQQKPDAQIFLASDTEFGILAFKQRYQDKVKFIDSVKRLPLDNILEWAFALSSNKPDEIAFINGKGYELQHIASESNNTDNFDLTFDLLKEVLCLSKCHILINSISNISLAISYINPEIKMITL